jgi:hypothetical protein
MQGVCRQHSEKRVLVLVYYSLPTACIARAAKLSMQTLGEYRTVFSLEGVPRVSKFVKAGAAKIAGEEGMKKSTST